MKNLLNTLLSFFLLILGANAQTITKDIQSENMRTIQTSYNTYAVTKGVFKGKHQISMMCICTEEDTTYYLVPEITLYTPSTIKENGKMLLKLKDGKTLTTICPLGIGKTDYQYRVIGYNTFYYIYPAYEIDYDDLISLVNTECTKLRIECNWGGGFFDIGLVNEHIKKFYLTDTVCEQYKLIQNRLKIDNSVYNGF